MKLRSVVLAVFSGLLLTIIFPTFNLHYLAWVALVPLLFALKGQTVPKGFWLGGITGIIHFSSTIYWITNSLHLYGHMPLILASLITLLLSAYLALYPALFGAAVVQLQDNWPALFFVAAPSLWTALELARTYVFSGFPWALLGYSQYSVLPVIQTADITGVYGVSFLIVLVNVAIMDSLMTRRLRPALIAALLVLVLTIGYGYSKLNNHETDAGVAVSVVQGNIAQDKKWDSAYQSAVIGVYKRLTTEALRSNPDLVIWPETATPFYFTGTVGADPDHTQSLVSFVTQNQVPLLFGSPTYEIKPNRQIIGRNSAFLVSGNGHNDGVYDKIHLVPFGEYVPIKSVFSFIEKIVLTIGDFQAGNAYTVLSVPYGGLADRKAAKIGTVICYEIIFPDLVRQFVEHGAGILATITNDAWFGRTAAPYQHFSIAVFRAVENRVPVARAANSGVSGFIDARGRILETSEIFTEAHLTRTLAPGNERTFYTRHGDIFAYLCILIALVMLAKLPTRNTRR